MRGNEDCGRRKQLERIRDCSRTNTAMQQSERGMEVHLLKSGDEVNNSC